MAAKKPRLPRVRPGAKKKVTICMSNDLDIALTVWSKMRGMTRSELADMLLAQALAGIEVTIDGKPVGPVESAA